MYIFEVLAGTVLGVCIGVPLGLAFGWFSIKIIEAFTKDKTY